MSFGLNIVGATYMRAMTKIFHDIIHKEIEDHLTHFKKFFDRLLRFNLKLNPTKCAFGVPSANHQERGIAAVLALESGQHYSIAAKLQFNCTNNMVEYKSCVLGLKMVIDMNVQELLVIRDSDLLIHQVQGEWGVENLKIKLTKNELVDAFATITSMIKHLDTDYIDPMDIELKEHPVHCSHVETEQDSLSWYFDIMKYLDPGIYLDNATFNQKKSIHCFSLNVFLSGEFLYRTTLDLGFLKCLDVVKLRNLSNRYMLKFVVRT
nr:uncharacterized protein LOC101247748 [Solanum lycopersicum]